MKQKVRIVNLEQGLPSVKQARARLESELIVSRRMGVTGLKLIHGYGSSGAGGKIRIEVRKYLSQQLAGGAVKQVIPGEKFSIFEEETRTAFRACNGLRGDEDLDRYNNGITVVIL